MLQSHSLSEKLRWCEILEEIVTGTKKWNAKETLDLTIYAYFPVNFYYYHDQANEKPKNVFLLKIKAIKILLTMGNEYESSVKNSFRDLLETMNNPSDVESIPICEYIWNLSICNDNTKQLMLGVPLHRVEPNTKISITIDNVFVETRIVSVTNEPFLLTCENGITIEFIEDMLHKIYSPLLKLNNSNQC